MKRYLVSTSPRSEFDVARLYARIAKTSPLNARRFVLKIEEAIAGLADVGASLDPSPEGRRYREPNIRQRIVKPYRIIYRVLEDRIEVITVRHGARRSAPHHDL